MFTNFRKHENTYKEFYVFFFQKIYQVYRIVTYFLTMGYSIILSGKLKKICRAKERRKIAFKRCIPRFTKKKKKVTSNAHAKLEI